MSRVGLMTILMRKRLKNIIFDWKNVTEYVRSWADDDLDEKKVEESNF
jgi:hypothetical protein